MAVVVSLAVSLARALSSPINFFDEGHVLDTAARMLQGEVLYRDIQSAYPPGQFLLMASAFAAVDTNVLVARLIDAAARTFLMVMCVIIVRRASPKLAFAGLAVAAGVLLSVQSHAYPMIPGLAFALLTLHLASGSWPGWPAGVALGLCATFRHEVAALVAVAVLAVVFEAARTARLSRAGAWTQILQTAAGATVTVAVVMSAFLVRAGPGTLWRNLVYEPFFVLGRLRGLPLPPFPMPALGRDPIFDRFLVPWRFWGLLGLTVVLLVLACRRGVERSPVAPGLTVLTAGLVYFATSRADDVHLLPAVLVAPLAVISLASPRSGVPRWVGHILLAGAVLAAFPYVRDPGGVLRSLRSNVLVTCNSRTPRASCFPTYPGADAAIVRARELTKPEDPVFVGLARHDNIFVNDIVAYLLLERASPTPLHQLVPTFATRAPQQRAIVDDLERSGTRTLILLDLGVNQEANESGRAPGSTILDEYIQRHFRPNATYGNYSVWVKGD